MKFSLRNSDGHLKAVNYSLNTITAIANEPYFFWNTLHSAAIRCALINNICKPSRLLYVVNDDGIRMTPVWYDLINFLISRIPRKIILDNEDHIMTCFINSYEILIDIPYRYFVFSIIYRQPDCTSDHIKYGLSNYFDTTNIKIVFNMFNIVCTAICFSNDAAKIMSYKLLYECKYIGIIDMEQFKSIQEPF